MGYVESISQGPCEDGGACIEKGLPAFQKFSLLSIIAVKLTVHPLKSQRLSLPLGSWEQ